MAASTTIAEEDTEDDSYPIPSKFEGILLIPLDRITLNTIYFVVSFNLGIDSTIEDYANAYNGAFTY